MKKILIAGGTGLIGKTLSHSLLSRGYEVGILSRTYQKSNEVKYHKWDLESMTIDDCISEYNYVVNLTGAGIADKRWSHKRKKEIIESRVRSTELLSNSFNNENNLRAVVNASAIGFYGDAGDLMLTENMNIQNKEFLSEVCSIWEKASESFHKVADRLIILRVGTVLSSEGGALSKMVHPIRLGLAGYLGNGFQWMSWIHIADISGMIIHLIENDEASGVYNGVSPNPIRNREFIRILKKMLSGFAIEIPLPKIVIKAIFGELSQLVLGSNRVSAQKILDAGFQFEYPKLQEAIQNLYGIE